MTDHVAEFRSDLKEFHEMTNKFYKKEINVAQYKGFRQLCPKRRQRQHVAPASHRRRNHQRAVKVYR